MEAKVVEEASPLAWGLAGAGCVLVPETILMSGWLWLMAGPRSFPNYLWFLVVVFLSFALTPLIRGDSYLGTDWGGLALLTIILMEIVIRWLVSLESPRPIQTDRDSGMLELVLVTPLTGEQVVFGLHSAMRPSLVGKVKVLVCCHFLQMFLC